MAIRPPAVRPCESSQVDCIALFEHRLLAAGILEPEDVERTHEEAEAQVAAAVEQATHEPRPTADDVFRHTYAPSPVDAVYPETLPACPTDAGAGEVEDSICNHA